MHNLYIMPPILICRDPLSAAPLTAELQQCGYQVLTAPLLRITPRMTTSLPAHDTLILTSSHALRGVTAPLNQAAGVFAMGALSAQAAQARGLKSVWHADGCFQTLWQMLERAALKKALYLRGAQIARNLSPLPLQEIVTYDAVPVTALPQPALECLRQQPFLPILLYSPRSAAVFFDLIKQSNIQLNRPRFFCLGLETREKCFAAGYSEAKLMPSYHVKDIAHALQDTRQSA